MTYLKIFLIIISAAVLFSCSSLTLTSADFSWPLESVLKIDNNGFVKEDRHSIFFDTKALFLEETQDSLGYAGKTLRLIRSSEGFYFMTAVDFKNVYVFTAEKNAFRLENKIQINETGLKNPAFNQRKPFIELLDDGITYKLSSDAIEGDVK
ncbi:MAG: hypothetical protein Q8M94_21770 [Ignavibacteria bacterium]|nr:hypothetical protein [Ignavibacteria bacterium]